MAITPGTQLTQPRPDLAEGLIQFDLEADQLGFVGQRLFPVIDVVKSYGEYPQLNLEELLGEEETRRAPDGSYNTVTMEGNKGSYKTAEYGIAAPVDANDDVNYAEWWDAEQLASLLSRDRTVRGYERRCLNKALSVTNSTAIGTAWSDKANATPFADIRTARFKVRDRTGILPDTLCLDVEAFENLRDTNDMLDRMFGSVNPERSASVTSMMVADALGLREVIVAGSVSNTANEAQAASVASMWTKTAGLLFKGGDGGSTSNLVRPRAFATMHWGEDGSQMGGAFESYEDPAKRCIMVRNRMQVEEKILYDTLAEKLTGIL